MPTLEHLKKQAKLYLRWHRDGYFPVAATISHYLSRYRDMTDKEVLLAVFKLNDAQELVARKYGFIEWSALKKGIEKMPKSTQSNICSSTLMDAEPQLFVTDVGLACQFYVDKLGFQTLFSYGEPPFYAQVGRGGARMNLRRVDGPVFDGRFRIREQDALSATITLDDAKPLFLEFQETDVPFHQALRTEPWGARTFIVKDPDGNLICFSGPSDEAVCD